jgi:hypothetical protein
MATTLDMVRRIAEKAPEDFPDMDDDFQSFIDLANDLADELCVGDSLITGEPHTEDRLDKIKTWLAAHFACILDPQLVREEVSTLRAVYQQEVKLGLSQTRYGDQAKILDTSGGLAAWDKQVLGASVKAHTSIGWLGKAAE